MSARKRPESETREHMTATCACGKPMTRGKARCIECARSQRRDAASRSMPDRFNRYAVRGEGCWGWSGAIATSGYGTLHVQTPTGHRVEKAHRVSWLLHRGPIPDGMHVLHTCDNRVCSNPDHLWLGTNADNVADKMAKGRYVNPRVSWVRATPELIQDAEDGAALRRLREAGGTWRMGNVRTAGRTIGYVAEAWSYVTGEAVKVLGHDDEDMMPPKFDTIAEAADACRVALEAGR